MPSTKLRFDLPLTPDEAVLVLQFVEHLWFTHNGEAVPIGRELNDRLQATANAAPTSEETFAILFGNSPPGWEIHVQETGVTQFMDVDGRADLDQLARALQILLPARLPLAFTYALLPTEPADGFGGGWVVVTADRTIGSHPDEYEAVLRSLANGPD